MIVSENKKPTLNDFSALCKSAEKELNKLAENDQNFFLNKTGLKLEPVIFDVLNQCAKNTPFENTLSLVSGQRFPDILINKYYGVEVKSTKDDQWKIIGGSVAEGTRIDSVENIFLMFGKLHKPVEFKTRRYQECLYDIAVTHSPRYKIDMDLKIGETIFDKMGIDYDTLRKEDNPIDEVVKYFRSTLKPGERLWWVPGESIEEKSIPLKIKLWNTLTPEEKQKFKLLGLIYYPEIFSNSSHKYERFILWLVTEYGIVSTSTRDTFSAGGQIVVQINSERFTSVPRLFKHIIDNVDYIKHILYTTPPLILKEHWNIETKTKIYDPIDTWANLIGKYTNSNRISDLIKKLMTSSNKAEIINTTYNLDNNTSNFQIKETSFLDLK